MDQLLGVKIGQWPKYFGNAFNFNLVSKEKEIGLEFEIEGDMLPTQADLNYHWAVTHDGSLRGPSAEYVLKKPVSFKYFKEKSFPYLTKYIHKKKSKLHISNRCSTHVHVNVQDLYGYQAVLMGMLYYVFEDLLTALYKRERKGNLFCVGSTESSDITRIMLLSIDKKIGNLMTEKYSAVNFSSICKYGSLEFRALQGTIEQEEVNTWIEYILSLRDYVKTVEPENIPNILGEMSVKSPVVFFKEIVPDKIYNKCLKHFNDDEESLIDAVYRGIDRMQPVFYEPAWETLITFSGMPLQKYASLLITLLAGDEKAMISLYVAASGKLKQTLGALAGGVLNNKTFETKAIVIEERVPMPPNHVLRRLVGQDPF